MTKPGTRVIAISSADETHVRLFGYGLYRGDEVPPDTVLFMGIQVGRLEHRNPAIVLENGKGIVWGCQCWFADASMDERIIAGRIVEEVPLPACPTDEEMKRARQETDPLVERMKSMMEAIGEREENGGPGIC